MKNFLLFSPLLTLGVLFQGIVLPLNLGLLVLIYLREKLAQSSILALIIFSSTLLDLTSGIRIGSNLIVYSLIFLFLDFLKSKFVLNEKQFFLLSLISLPLWEFFIRAGINLK